MLHNNSLLFFVNSISSYTIKSINQRREDEALKNEGIS